MADWDADSLLLHDNLAQLLPDVVVAEAVAASIAIPGLFKPAAIPSFCDDAKTAFARYYADGGLVSNLPVWCFSEEKAAAERRRPNSEAIPIVAFTLRDPSLMNSANVVLRPLRYFRQVIQSAIFGGQTVVQEFVSDLYPIQLPSSLGLLTFDATWAQAKSAHGEAKQKAFAELRQRLILEPGEWSSVLASACQEIQKNILSHIPATGITDLRLRAAVFERKLPSMSRNQPLAVVALDTDEDILRALQGNQVLLNLIIEATSGISALMTERRRNDL
jgi:predicted acylesterase/phospholipase RssA